MEYPTDYDWILPVVLLTTLGELFLLFIYTLREGEVTDGPSG